MKKYNNNNRRYKTADQIIATTTNQDLKQKLINRKKENGRCVYVENGRIELAIKRLKRKIKDNKILEDYYKHLYYTTPSQIKKQKKRKKKLKIKYLNLQKKQLQKKSNSSTQK